MMKLVTALCVLALFVGSASARHSVEYPEELERRTPAELERRAPRNTVMWFDDLDGPIVGWQSVDPTVDWYPRFHVDSYMAYAGDYSWWCGCFDYDANGGYGNGWIEWMVLPPIDLSGCSAVEEVSWGELKAMYRDGTPERVPASPVDCLYPVFTFAYRHDSEDSYDFTWVQAESNGVYVNLNRGYDGVAPWTDVGPYGYLLLGYDNPVQLRFEFQSDPIWSDQDQFYLSNGGAFMCDNLKVYDYFTGNVLFFDDVESGGLCYPGNPWPTGDYWHIVDNPPAAYSDPYCFWCGDDAAPELIPPLLRCELFSPLINISGATVCTVFFAAHFEIPTVDNDFVQYYGTCNGLDYYSIGVFWGDFGTPTGWSAEAYNRGYDIGQFCPGALTTGGFMWKMHTTDNGCGPGATGTSAGYMLDDIWMEANLPGPRERGSWRAIKSLVH